LTKNESFKEYEINYTMDSVVNEIFRNTFDITWHQKYKNEGSAQKTWGLIEGENSKDDGTVVYQYNSEYFRSDEFTSEHTGKHVVFAGCSETEGEGGNIEDSWGKIAFNKINSSIALGKFYNLGKAGYGWQKIISQIRIYIKQYGKPDALFVLLPNVGRSIEWSELQNTWYAKQSYPNFNKNKPLVNKKNYSKKTNLYFPHQTPEEYKKAFMDFVISWRLFEDFCLAANIKLIWGTWEYLDNHNFSKLDLFNNFVPLPREKIMENIDLYRKNANLDQFDLQKRDGHSGRLFHEYWANEMVAEANKRGFFND